MNIQFWIHEASYNNFLGSLSAVVRNVDSGTKAATERACLEIMSESLAQVPIDTGSLASTAYYNVTRRADISGYRYQGVIGYAGIGGGGGVGYSVRVGNGGVINPKNGIPVSKYAIVVHEDLQMPHPRGGKPKFLEDPVREYGQANFKRVVEQYWRVAIRKSSILYPNYAYGRATGSYHRTTEYVPEQLRHYSRAGNVWGSKTYHHNISFDLGTSNKGNYRSR